MNLLLCPILFVPYLVPVFGTVVCSFYVVYIPCPVPVLLLVDLVVAGLPWAVCGRVVGVAGTLWVMCLVFCRSVCISSEDLIHIAVRRVGEFYRFWFFRCSFCWL